MPWLEDESLPELAPVEPPCAPEDDEPPVEPEPPVTDELPSAPVPDEDEPDEPDEPPIAPDEPALDAPPEAPDEPVFAEPDSDEPLMVEFDEPVDDEPVDDDDPIDDDPIDDEPAAPLDDPLMPPLLPAPLLEPVDGLALCDELPDRLPDDALLLLFRLLDLSSLPMLLPLLLASTPFPSLDF